jgi:hypothetical protein
VVHDVELFFGNGRTRMTSHQYCGRVLKDHEDQQEEFEITGIVGSFGRRRHFVVVVVDDVVVCFGVRIGMFKRICRLDLFRHGKSL